MSTDYKKKCIIVDDDLQNIAILEHICNEFFSNEIEIINTFSIATEALKFINSEKIDIIFLDIEMPELNGIEFIKAMKHPHPLIVLTTSHPEFALEAYEHNVLDYLVKPIALPRFLNAVAKAQAMFEKHNIDKIEIILVVSYVYQTTIFVFLIYTLAIIKNSKLTTVLLTNNLILVIMDVAFRAFIECGMNRVTQDV